jgi:transaldolase
VNERRGKESGPAIWLAGDPEDLKAWMPRGAYGIVTNTVVLNDMVKKYGQITEVTKRYLDITDKPVVIEIDGHSTQELLDVGEVFVKMAPGQVILKIPTTEYALDAFAELKKRGVETFCTTVFTLPQAAAVAAAGVTHVLPFCEPYRQVGGDPTKLVREARAMFEGWADRPFVTAALVRSVETAEACFRDGADGIIVFWPVFRDMLKSKLTDEWNATFLDQWNQMYDAGLLKGIPVKRH